MKNPIEDRDLTQEAPHSPRERFGDFAILSRTTDKCRATLAGSNGEYHYDCPLDNQLFSFMGINGSQFKKEVESAECYEDVATWVKQTGNKKTPQEIRQWSDKMESMKLTDVPSFKDPEHRKDVEESCRKLGLDFESSTLFEWLEADDQASFEHAGAHAK